MRKALGILCVILGIVCLMASLGLVLHNRWQEESAETATDTLLQEYRRFAPESPTQPPQLPDMEEPDSEPIAEETRPMPAVSIQGYGCIGLLSIPVLELELPVLADWSYDKLNVAPCQYYGTCYGPDFVIAAHNYSVHFGKLSLLQPGDLVLFTDTTGEVFCYEVTLLETLAPQATEEMITSGFDLSLYTCTPSGSNRVTARCTKIDPTSIKTK